MKPGPRPQPDNIRRLNGFPDKKGEREKIKPDPIAPTMPTWLSKQGKANWKFLAPELEKNALLTKRDLHSFAFLCEEAAIAQGALLAMRPQLGDSKKRAENFELIQTDPAHENRLRRHPALIVWGQSVERFRRMCDEFGLTPASRVHMPGGLPPIAMDDDDEDDAELFGT